jgi:hypothetical protein
MPKYSTLFFSLCFFHFLFLLFSLVLVRFATISLWISVYHDANKQKKIFRFHLSLRFAWSENERRTLMNNRISTQDHSLKGTKHDNFVSSNFEFVLLFYGYLWRKIILTPKMFLILPMLWRLRWFSVTQKFFFSQAISVVFFQFFLGAFGWT